MSIEKPGDMPCPNCGFAYDNHGMGGNCATSPIPKKPKPNRSKRAGYTPPKQ